MLPLTRGEMISLSVCVPDGITPVEPAGSPVQAPRKPAAEASEIAVAHNRAVAATRTTRRL